MKKRLLAFALSFAIGLTSLSFDVRAAETELIVTDSVESGEASDAAEVDPEKPVQPDETKTDESEDESEVEPEAESEDLVAPEAEIVEDEELEEDAWEISLGDETLYCNQEGADFTEITVQVTGTEKYKKQNPTFTSSDTNIVTVTVQKGNPKTATIQAVGPGTATISVKFAGETRTKTIKVTRADEIEGIAFVDPEITLGWSSNRYSNHLAILPSTLDLENEDIHIEYSGYDSDFISVTQDKNDPTAFEIYCKKYYTDENIDKNTTTITATFKYGDNPTPYTAQCVVKYDLRMASDAAKRLALDYSITDFYVITNCYNKKNLTLADITIPKLDENKCPYKEYLKGEVTWCDDTLPVVADNARPVQYFEACYKEPGHESVVFQLPVCITRIAGMKSYCEKNQIYWNQRVFVTTECNMVGYKLSETELVERAMKIYDNLKFDYQPQTANGESYLSNQFMETSHVETSKYWRTSFMIDNPKDGRTKDKYSIKVTLQAGEGKPFVSTANTTVIYENVISNLNFKIDEGGESKQVEQKDNHYYYNVNLSDFEAGKTTIKITASPYPMRKYLSDKTKLKWSSDDKKVATVVADADDSFSAVVTLNKIGTTDIRVQSTDSAKYESFIMINGADYSPIIGNKKLTLNYNKYDLGYFAIKAKIGTEITAVDFTSAIDAKTKQDYSTCFGIINEDKLGWAVGFCPPENGDAKSFPNTIQMNLTVKYKVGDQEYTEDYPVTINIKKDLPKINVKCTQKADLATTVSYATFYLTSSDDIESISGIKKTPIDDSGFVGYTFYNRVLADDGNAGVYYGTGKSAVVNVAIRGLNSEKISKYFSGANAKKAKTVDIEVRLKGYYEPVIVTLNVPTTKNRITAKASDIIMVPGDDSGLVSIQDSYTKTVYELDPNEDTIIPQETKPGKTPDFDFAIVGNQLQVSRNNPKATSYKVTMKLSMYSEPVVVSGRVINAKQYEIGLDRDKVILNTAENWKNNGGVLVKTSVKNSVALLDGKVTYSGADKITAEALKAGYLIPKVSKSGISVGLATDDGGDTFKRYRGKTFKLKINGNVRGESGNSYEAKPATLTVVTSTKAARGIVKYQGYIDIPYLPIFTPEVKDAGLRCEVKFENTSAKLTDIELVGVDSTRFYVSSETINGVVSSSFLIHPIVARPGAGVYFTTEFYNPTIRFTMDNGTVIDTKLKFKVKNTTPDVKLTARDDSVLYRNTVQQSITYQMAVSTPGYSVYSASVDGAYRTNFYCKKVSNQDCIEIAFRNECSNIKPGTYNIPIVIDYYNQTKYMTPVKKTVKVIVK